MAWSFVCPASRGIGHAITRNLLQTSKVPVVATTRKDPDAVKRSILDDLEGVDSRRLTVLEVDVADESTISAAAEKVKSLFPTSSHHLRLAFAIPGILHPEKSPSQIDTQHALDTFKINTIGPLLLIKHFSQFLPRKKDDLVSEPQDHSKAGGDDEGLPPHAVWASMAARVGSTTDNKLGGWYSYRASKAGVMSLTKTFDLYLQQQKSAGEKPAMAIALHPGTVKTELSREFWGSVPKKQLFTPEYAAEKLVHVVKTVGSEGRGKCWDWKGEEILP